MPVNLQCVGDFGLRKKKQRAEHANSEIKPPTQEALGKRPPSDVNLAI